MRTASRLAAASLSLSVLLVPAVAGAVEVPNVGGKPILIDVTNTSIFDYHFQNRNEAANVVETRVDDNYGEWLDRFNLQASWWRFRLGLRLDSAVYFSGIDDKKIHDIVDAETVAPPGVSLAEARNAKVNDYYRELHSRYLNAFYPAKLFVGYNQPGLDITVGDFYAQLGRGLVFSVRKIDELAVDTTVRGGKIVADHDFGKFRLGGTLFMGQMNPLRLDETSGRRLHGDGSPLFFGFPRSGDLVTYPNFDAAGQPVKSTEAAFPSYLEDTAFGAHVEAGPKLFLIGGNASVLARKSYTAELQQCILDKDADCTSRFPDFNSTDASKVHNTIVTYSGSLSVPSIAKHGDLYVEVAGQSMRDGHLVIRQTDDGTPPQKQPDLSGYAVYANASITAGPVAISLEGKHYRSFFPLSANIDTGRKGFAAPEYSLIAYSQLPTVEPIYTEPVSGGAPNVCITGGRGRVDYRFDRGASVYAWLGRYASWSDRPSANNNCEISDALRSDTWDAAVGTDLALEKGQSHVRAYVGARTTDLAAPIDTVAGYATTSFYREGYIRYDLIKHLGGRFSVQAQGFVRRRYEPVTVEKAWTEGENYTALQWSPHLAAVFGYEYLVRKGCQPGLQAELGNPAVPDKDVCHFFNGGVTWRSNAGDEGSATQRVLGRLFDTVGIFVGQRRGALRCVSGVCRQFPPFEGAKLEITSRF